MTKKEKNESKTTDLEINPTDKTEKENKEEEEKKIDDFFKEKIYYIFDEKEKNERENEDANKSEK